MEETTDDLDVDRRMLLESILLRRDQWRALVKTLINLWIP